MNDPDNLAMLPKEATDEMLAAIKAVPFWSRETGFDHLAREYWRVMAEAYIASVPGPLPSSHKEA